MSELLGHSENREKILPYQTLLFAEPIFKNPGMDESKKTTFTVPHGTEAWIKQITFDRLTGENITKAISNEYLSIVSTLKEMKVPFRIIIAHRKALDERKAVALMQYFGIRGLALDPQISETCFPRDMMVDFDGKTYVNPNANISFPDHSEIRSPLGEGGRILKLGKKVFSPDPRGYIQTRPKYAEDIRSLSNRFQFGFLPHPLGVKVDTKSNKNEYFPNDHIDRVAAFIKGKDNKDYLLLDKNYAKESEVPYGNYWTQIKETCQKLEVTPVVIERESGAIPYALNLEQFADKMVLLSGGDNILADSVRQIVGIDKVYLTNRPIVFYPLYRNGGIRCMLLHAPQKIVGKPIIS